MLEQREHSRSRNSGKLLKEHFGEPELHKILDEFDIQKVRNAFLKEENGEMNMEQLQKLLTEVSRTVFDTAFFQLMFRKMNSSG